ncbi:MAG: hypothetical protein HY078_16570 [Elusimicrobia bacterium]|nr:hypothetical protein [Elusimicrobiota bacterium]
MRRVHFAVLAAALAAPSALHAQTLEIERAALRETVSKTFAEDSFAKGDVAATFERVRARVREDMLDLRRPAFGSIYVCIIHAARRKRFSARTYDEFEGYMVTLRGELLARVEAATKRGDFGPFGSITQFLGMRIGELPAAPPPAGPTGLTPEAAARELEREINATSFTDTDGRRRTLRVQTVRPMSDPRNAGKHALAVTFATREDGEYLEVLMLMRRALTRDVGGYYDSVGRRNNKFLGLETYFEMPLPAPR